MKTIFLLFGIVLIIISLVGADLRREKENTEPEISREPCYGYTIVEFGKGIDCYGDTVTLTKVQGGGQALARMD